jgi:hypothetical protein
MLGAAAKQHVEQTLGARLRHAKSKRRRDRQRYHDGSFSEHYHELPAPLDAGLSGRQTLSPTPWRMYDATIPIHTDFVKLS